VALNASEPECQVRSPGSRYPLLNSSDAFRLSRPSTTSGGRPRSFTPSHGLRVLQLLSCCDASGSIDITEETSERCRALLGLVRWARIVRLRPPSQIFRTRHRGLQLSVDAASSLHSFRSSLCLTIVSIYSSSCTRRSGAKGTVLPSGEVMLSPGFNCASVSFDSR